MKSVDKYMLSHEKMICTFSFKKWPNITYLYHSNFVTSIMWRWTISCQLGLVLMLLASVEANSSLQQYTALRQEFNNTEQLQELNTGNYIHKSILLLQVKLLF